MSGRPFVPSIAPPASCSSWELAPSRTQPTQARASKITCSSFVHMIESLQRENRLHGALRIFCSSYQHALVSRVHPSPCGGNALEWLDAIDFSTRERSRISRKMGRSSSSSRGRGRREAAPFTDLRIQDGEGRIQDGEGRGLQHRAASRRGWRDGGRQKEDGEGSQGAHQGGEVHPSPHPLLSEAHHPNPRPRS